MRAESCDKRTNSHTAVLPTIAKVVQIQGFVLVA